MIFPLEIRKSIINFENMMFSLENITFNKEVSYLFRKYEFVDRNILKTPLPLANGFTKTPRMANTLGAHARRWDKRVRNEVLVGKPPTGWGHCIGFRLAVQGDA